MAKTNWPFPSFVSPFFKAKNIQKCQQYQKIMDFPTNTVSLCSPSVQCRVDMKTKPLTCDICCLCPWLLPSGSPRSALLQPLGACTCFQSLSACSSKYKLLSPNCLVREIPHSAVLSGCWAVHTGRRSPKEQSTPGYISNNVHIPQKMEGQEKCF